ncbi:MAG TPA: hypothetical protein VHW02_01680 [Rhizomicrobium sp.]|jgi:hypothetical protein|nr:hypothetical protein [Rhizomicrobium sp.]
MKTIGKACTAILSMFAMSHAAWAGAECAGAQDVAALKTAVIQQELMVAALTCHDVEAYNRFVVTFQPDLQKSDAVLLAFFQRRNAQSGTDDYQAYKTHLANGNALRSVRDDGFCARADAWFRYALQRNALTAVLDVMPTAGLEYASCSKPGIVEAKYAQAETVTGGSSAANWKW